MRQGFMQLGRSMVEMLGVLAIIGVLSIVGIQGYKKAIAKHKANEVLNLVMRVWNEGETRAVVNPTLTSTQGNLYSNALPERITDTTYALSRTQNLGIEKPSWAKDLELFTIRISMKPATGTVANQTYRNMWIYGMGTCDACEELLSVTEPTSEEHVRMLKGSNQGTLTDGVKLRCATGSSTSPVGTQCF